MKNSLIYHERLCSTRTEALFAAFTLLFLLLMVWRVNSGYMDGLVFVFLGFSCFFLFYAINYRILDIRLTPDLLKLSFGIFHWAVPMNNIKGCYLDNPPFLLRFGGAGIHFMTVNKKYRASFNFLEYSRVAIIFKKNRGPVSEISFTTQQPEMVIQFVNMHKNKQ